MILSPAHLFEATGFKQILEKLATLATLSPVKEKILGLIPVSHPGKIRSWLMEVEEMSQLLRASEPLPPACFREPSTWLIKAAVHSSFLTEDEVFRLLGWLQGIKQLSVFLDQRKLQYPALCARMPDFPVPSGLVDFLSQHIGPDGKLKDKASPELFRLRRQIQESGITLRRLMEKIHRYAREQGWTEERQPTIRNQRMVIPLIADFKGKIQGFVQDVSQSGQTIFLEPAEALALNNEINELQIRERNEIHQILVRLTDAIRDKIPALQAWEELIYTYDLIQAKAKLSNILDAGIPQLEGSCEQLSLVNARNPLLLLQKGQSVVPLSVELNRNHRILIISGPNAGGKSVALKTIAQLCLMVQCGIPIPADSNSVIPVLTGIFVDLGDGQSIENDLSTYTSHLRQMKEMMGRCQETTLFLIDEFGTGTDPKAGGPMAAAILERLIIKRSLGVITTHYSDLKKMGYQHPSVINAAMAFDIKTLLPLYKLIIGKPGSSYAFEIARRAGIPEIVLNRGKERMGKSHADSEELLAELNQEKEKLFSWNQELIQQEKKLLAQIEQLKEKENQALEKAKKIIADAKETARILVLEARIKIEKVLLKSNELPMDKTLKKVLHKDLTDISPVILIDQLESKIEEEEQNLPEYETQQMDINPGDKIQWLKTGAIGIVLEKADQKVWAAFGELKTLLKLKEVKKIKQKTQNQEFTFNVQHSEEKIKQTANASTILDVRGQRAETAQQTLHKFLDEAILAGLPALHIIHGKGNGVLRKITHEVLNSNPSVESFKVADQNQGGSGATQVNLK